VYACEREGGARGTRESRFTGVCVYVCVCVCVRVCTCACSIQGTQGTLKVACEAERDAIRRREMLLV
jgi:hypothetical protein